MAVDEAFGRRVFAAIKDLEKVEGRDIPLSEIGERVAAALRRGKPYAQGTVSGWRSGIRPEDYVIRALAAVLHVDPDWLLRGHRGRGNDGTGALRVAGDRRR